MDNPKVERKQSALAGFGVFARKRISAGELIAEFDGEIYPFQYAGWTEELLNHTIQFERYRFRDSIGLARFINHSCEPNCGIKRLFQIVAMRAVEPGEEITFDYEMAEDSEWRRMRCQCGMPRCRGIIGAYRNLPPEARARYAGFISEWLPRGNEDAAATG